jgi:hypothetical protein
MTRNRLLNAFITGIVASATATVYILVMGLKHDMGGPLGPAIVAFGGAGCAGYAVAKGFPRSALDAVKLILLGDLFAFCIFMFLPFAIGIIHENSDALPAPTSNTIWQKLPGFALFYITAFAFGNVLTRGVGFVMMVPPVLLTFTAPRDRR